VFTPSTHAFDPVTQAWEKLPDAPVPFGYAGSTTVDNRLFVLGGYTGSEMNSRIFVLEKDGKNYAWKVFGRMPVPRVFA
jgi:N-acetylneuraminic acid mutarotase